MTTVFQPFVEAAKKARAQVQAEFDKLGATVKVSVKQSTAAAGSAAGALPGQVKKGTDDAEKEYAKLAKQAEKWRQEMVRSAEKAMRDEVRAQEKAAKAEYAIIEKTMRDSAAMHERGEREKTRATERESRKRAAASAATGRSNARAVERMNAGNAQSAAMGLRTGLGVVSRAGRMAIGAGAQLGGDLLHGLGVNTDPTSMFAGNVALESGASRVANAGYMAGAAGPNGQRQDAKSIAEEVRRTSIDTGMDAESGMKGLEQFVGKTGELDTGRAVLKDMAMLSRATGTEFEHMVSAAGEVSNILGDIPNKGEAIYNVMKGVAGEGKLGAVEISDLAKQMAKVASSAGQIEGDRGKNILMLGAFAQEARQHGGAASAAQAATAVSGLINTFKTPARIAEFEAATGNKVFNSGGELRNLEDLVKEALSAKGMDPMGFKKIFSNVQGARAVEGYATIYRHAGGGKAGLEAVDAEMNRLKSAAMQDAEVMESFARSMKTSEAQANVFNAKMQETAQGVQDVVKPALLELAPVAVQLAQEFGGALQFMIGHNAAARAAVANAAANVDGDLAAIGKALGMGRITQQQLDKNKADEGAAHMASMGARVRAEEGSHDKRWGGMFGGPGKTGATSRYVQNMADAFNPMAWMTGDTAQSRFKKEDKAQDARVDQVKQSMEKWDEIKKANERIAELLSDGLIVTIKNPTPTGGGDGKPPPNNPGSVMNPAPSGEQ